MLLLATFYSSVADYYSSGKEFRADGTGHAVRRAMNTGIRAARQSHNFAWLGVLLLPERLLRLPDVRTDAGDHQSPQARQAKAAHAQSVCRAHRGGRFTADGEPYGFAHSV